MPPATPMATVLCLGVAVIDAIFQVPEIPKRPVKARAHGYREIGGGMAATGAVAIVRLGGAARMLSRVGDDDLGHRVIAGLAEEGVDTSGIRAFPGRVSTRAAVLVDDSGERLLAGYKDPEMECDASWLPLDGADTPDAVLVDHDWAEGAAAVLRWAAARGVPSVLDCDTATHEAAQLIALASHPILSEVALAQLTGKALARDGLAALQAPGRFLGVTVGEAGFLWCGADGVIRQMAPPAVTAVDTLGAGDVFHGAFALGLGEGMAEKACARFATTAAALKCTRPGGRAGAPTRAEVDCCLVSGAVPA